MHAGFRLGRRRDPAADDRDRRRPLVSGANQHFPAATLAARHTTSCVLASGRWPSKTTRPSCIGGSRESGVSTAPSLRKSSGRRHWIGCGASMVSRRPPIWSLSLNLDPPHALRAEWCEEDSILGDYMRVVSGYQEHDERPIELRSLIGDDQLPARLQSETWLTDPLQPRRSAPPSGDARSGLVARR